MLELKDEDIIAVIISVFYAFKELSGDMKEVKKTQR